MTEVERASVNKSSLDASALDYSPPAYDRKFFEKTYPQFDPCVHEIMELYERGVRYKQYKQMLKSRRAKAPKPALVAITNFKEGYSPF